MSPKLPRITAAELLRALRRDGWEIVRQKGGSHVQLKHPTKAGRVTVSMHSGEIILPRTLRQALDQADLTVEELRRLL